MPLFHLLEILLPIFQESDPIPAPAPEARKNQQKAQGFGDSRASSLFEKASGLLGHLWQE